MLRKTPVHELPSSRSKTMDHSSITAIQRSGKTPCSPPVANSAASGSDSSAKLNPPTDSPDEPPRKTWRGCARNQHRGAEPL